MIFLFSNCPVIIFFILYQSVWLFSFFVCSRSYKYSLPHADRYYVGLHCLKRRARYSSRGSLKCAYLIVLQPAAGVRKLYFKYVQVLCIIAGLGSDHCFAGGGSPTGCNAVTCLGPGGRLEFWPPKKVYHK